MHALILFCCLIPTGPSLSVPQWQALTSLPPGTEIRIETASLWPFRAEMVGASDGALIVRQGGHVRNYAHGEVVRVDRRVPGSNRGRHANLGLLAGLGVGLVRAALCDGCSAFGMGLVVVPSMAVGGVAGAVRSPASWATIYRRGK